MEPAYVWSIKIIQQSFCFRKHPTNSFFSFSLVNPFSLWDCFQHCLWKVICNSEKSLFNSRKNKGKCKKRFLHQSSYPLQGRRRPFLMCFLYFWNSLLFWALKSCSHQKPSTTLPKTQNIHPDEDGSIR